MSSTRTTMRRYTRYGTLHPIRRGVMPTDRVQRTRTQDKMRTPRGGGAWPNNESTRQAAGQRPSTTGVEGTGGTDCGTRGRLGLAGQHTGTPTDGRPPRGLRGLAAVPVDGGRARAGLEIDHSEPSGSRVAISRAGRRPPAHTAARPIKAGRAAAGDLSGPQATTGRAAS